MARNTSRALSIAASVAAIGLLAPTATAYAGHRAFTPGLPGAA